jgi:hypothetical protein
MDGSRFDGLVRSLPKSRRSLFGGALTVATLRLGVADAGARKKGKKKPKKPRPNAYGCLNLGAACNGDSDRCCSGICEGTKPKKGKKDTSRCVAHDIGICTPGSNACTLEVVGACNSGNVDCYCLRTTGKATFCGATGDVGDMDLLCRDCRRDTDCQGEFGPGAACVDFGAGICSSLCPSTGGNACVPPCPDADM